MCAEYKGLRQMSRELANEFKNTARDQGLDVHHLIQVGAGFLKNGSIKNITLLEDLPDGVRADARKINSPWNVILPIANSSKRSLNVEARDSGKLRRGHPGKKHRGDGFDGGPELRQFLMKPHRQRHYR